ncbi:nuclear transport factor 2 family protein [Neorhizobium galegae]|uniref:nuclear transport factor 2 family protein n=1 Tax=Neorhizobium galegae TaxID=399 RepID=UPI0006213111|nr:DUF4440 domain-containing protein [Neorhizobium galegae]KAB1124194.1 DUF4440 domain-containing protein [Neorhizobium galegae]MCQ1809703.1 DUF4440 domain-containing protein [Neorhizobium galegae]CDZ57368.1 Hypothetical protein NGAL_HAMBI2566_19220 [Neorhizobium galegae bv. orientalis]
MTARSSLADHLLALELALQSREVRGSEQKLRELLAPEFGRSGLAYTFDDIVTRLVAETGPNNTSISDFSATMLSDTIALATYRGTRINDDGSQLFANRSSIWRLDPDGKWRMVFHQGTATE